MALLRRLTPAVLSVLFAGACAQLIGLGDYETGEGDDEGGGTSGSSGAGRGGSGGSSSGKGGSSGNGGTAGKGGKGGTSGGGNGGTSGQGGEAGQAGEAGDGGDAGEPSGGSSGRGGTGGMGGGGMAGGGMGGGGMAGGGMAGGGVAGGGMAGGGTGGCGSTMTVELLQNGNLDSAPAGANWSVIDNNGSAIIVSATSIGQVAQSAPNIMHFGGGDSLFADITQVITIPAGTTTLTFTGYRRITSSESGGPYDFLTAELYLDIFDPNSDLARFVQWSDVNVTPWSPFSYSIDASALAGQTVYFDLWSRTDGSIFTDFFLDSLALMATVCQ